MDGNSSRNLRLKNKKTSLSKELNYKKMEQIDVPTDRAKFFMTGDSSYLAKKSGLHR